MHVTLKLYGNLKRYAPNQQEIGEMSIEPGTTVASLLTRLGVREDEVWMSAVNDVVTEGATVLEEGDVIEVFEPVGGGQPGAA